MGIQIATSIRVGQYLGAGNPVGAMTTGRLGITLVCEYLTFPSNQGPVQDSLQRVVRGGGGGGEGVGEGGSQMILENVPNYLHEFEKKNAFQ